MRQNVLEAGLCPDLLKEIKHSQTHSRNKIGGDRKGREGREKGTETKEKWSGMENIKGGTCPGQQRG